MRRPSWRRLLLAAPLVLSGGGLGFSSSSSSSSRGGRAPARLDHGLRAVWRVYDVAVGPEADPGAAAPPTTISEALTRATAKRVAALTVGAPKKTTKQRRPPRLTVRRVVRKSLDTRKARGGPRWSYVVDAEVVASQDAAWRPVPGRLERRRDDDADSDAEAMFPKPGSSSAKDTLAPRRPRRSTTPRRPRVVVVGCGPAGLFCALELASTAAVDVTLLDRGDGVERRGADIGRLVHRKALDRDSNFAFGEGGAGTWSDGKLTTRIGRNDHDVRRVLRTLVAHGAPEAILAAGAPHLGTDTLVRVLRALRARLRELGVEIKFRTKVEAFETTTTTTTTTDGGMVTACRVVDAAEDTTKRRRIAADAVVVATGHSADDTYSALLDAGAHLETKGLAVGYRVEHPQALVNAAAYGRLALGVHTGRRATDAANRAWWGADTHENTTLPVYPRLPVASYRLSANELAAENRSAYSFCCCPGGQVVPATTAPDLVVVNGMSFSRRDSQFANAALVVSVDAEDPVLDEFRAEHGALAALAFQRRAERTAARLGGGDFVAPVARLSDFVRGDGRPRGSSARRSTRIASSYRLGVREADVAACYPDAINDALREAVLEHFERAVPGFVSDAAILHGVETRTSAPVRVDRDPATLESSTLRGLYPCGEGAGYAGGIVSAAVDGMRVARAVAARVSVVSS